MRYTITLALATATCSLSAQLQNGGFEDLNTLNMPSYWSTGIELITIGDSVAVDSAKYLLNSTDVHSGLHAVELRNAYNYTQDQGSPGRWFASPFEEGYQGFPSPDVQLLERPERVSFWAKYQPVQGDSGYAEVSVYNEFMDQIGFGEQRIGGLVSAYTLFEMPIAYSSLDSAVFIHLRFTTITPGRNAHLGTRMLVDDVDVEYTATGIGEVNTTALGLFPNPATDAVRLMGVDLGPQAAVRIADATGRTVLAGTLANGQLALDGLAPGTYLVQVDRAGAVYQSRLVVAH